MALKPMESASESGAEEADAILSEINITPLVDIFLVLLIIFMVTSSVLSQLGVDVSLPSAPSASTSQESQEAVIVTLSADSSGGVKVNGQAIRGSIATALEPALRAAFAQTKSRGVVLEGDQRAFLGQAVEVMEHAKRAGALQFSIATQGGAPGGGVNRSEVSTPGER